MRECSSSIASLCAVFHLLFARQPDAVLDLAVESITSSHSLTRRSKRGDAVAKRHPVFVSRQGARDDRAIDLQAVGHVLFIQDCYGIQASDEDGCLERTASGMTVSMSQQGAALVKG